MTWLLSKAMMEAYGNSPYSPEQEEAYLADTCSDGEQFAQLNVMPTPHKFWRNDKTMEFSNLSRFGLTLRLLTESRGEELLTSFLAGFRVRTLAVQIQKVQALTAVEAVYGNNSKELLARLDRKSSMWKIPQCSLFEDLERSLEIWPRSGSMRNGVCYQAQMLGPGIYGKECGSFVPTPTATDYKGGRSQAHRKDGTPTTSEFRHWCRVFHGLTYPIPMHMEAMMGWPIGWTALEPLAMGRFQSWQQQHSLYSLREQELYEVAI